MAIIKLKPAFKDYLWGGQKLKENYGKVTDMNPLAESWEVSTHADGPSIINEGEYQGLTLGEYIAKKDRQPLGLNGRKFEQFPVLVKFIDALQDLSIQVHPNDEYGMEHEGEYGKTEMWYILDSEPGSKIYYGTNKELTRDEFKASIDNQTVLDNLKHVEVSPGDVIFVEAGTIHAIGAGIVICEIQQNSNTTYRVYDFHRKDAEGNLRDLHIEKALDVSNLTPLPSDFKAQKELETFEDHTKQVLVSCPYFTTTKYEVKGAFDHNVSDESFEAVIVLDGALSIITKDSITDLKKGETCFIDANTSDIQITGEASFLSVRV